jgi:hypothetical protein
MQAEHLRRGTWGHGIRALLIVPKKPALRAMATDIVVVLIGLGGHRQDRRACRLVRRYAQGVFARVAYVIETAIIVAGLGITIRTKQTSELRRTGPPPDR